MSALTMPCVYELVRRAAERGSDHTAISAPGRQPLTYRRLLEHVTQVVAALNGAGIGRDDRVATLVPDGPAAAVAFLALASGTTVAPLNPAYRAAELATYLRSQRATAIVVAPETDAQGAAAARALGIPVIRVVEPDEQPAGLFTLDAPAGPPAPRGGYASAEDIALVLHTSGTTSQPKIVPLTHSNICASASNVRDVLGLEPADRCLSIMPQFHVHGLIGGLLASVAAGAEVACTPGFYASEFFPWLAALRPTWFTAVPTMHQAILARAPRYAEILAGHSLRCIRSASAALPPRVRADLEATFNVPVVEAYGMTEAAHQIASASVVKEEHRAGSVGRPAGAEVAVVDADGEPLPAGTVGEVVIRGPGVTHGYEGEPDVNARAFVRGWLRTGDLGYRDGDGYLFLTSRIKDIINRGGETIAPGEIEHVLLEHQAVAQAVVFGVPDERLGEDVAAAVVLHPSAAVSERDVRAFVAARLSPAKVPRVVHIVDHIPLGATGKVQRSALPHLLGPRAAADANRAAPALANDVPLSPLEQALGDLWGSVLALASESVGANDDFFYLGGDSVLAAQVISRVRALTGVDVPLNSIYEGPTLAEFARSVEEASATDGTVTDEGAPAGPRTGGQG